MTQVGKTTIRAEMLKRRQSMSMAEVKAHSRVIGDQVLVEITRLLAGDTFKVSDVGMYAPIKNEVDPTPLFEIFRNRRLCCYFPRIENDLLKFYVSKNLSDLVAGEFGILEPSPHSTDLECSVSAKVPSVLLVPGVAFSLQGHRIGYGKGYYDKTYAHWLQSNQRPLLSIGLAYDFQILDDVPHSELDVPVDVVISENRILRRGLP